ncbi:MAG: hypothetical protein Fur0044_34660 [Anaerolineae bacterium]|nr:hypothetical protein [Anaerolineales bacterium]MCQ3977184.1 hypothetical protein [Anaerolineae bacterium]
MASIPNSEIIEGSWSDVSEDTRDDLPRPPSRLRAILSRAVMVYLGLFLGISLLLSLLGVNPLTHGGLIPQCLLVYVGLSLLLALAQTETNLIDEQVRSRLALYTHWPRPERAAKREHNLD